LTQTRFDLVGNVRKLYVLSTSPLYLALISLAKPQVLEVDPPARFRFVGKCADFPNDFDRSVQISELFWYQISGKFRRRNVASAAIIYYDRALE